MTLLAHAPSHSKSQHSLSYEGRMVCDLGRFAELSRESLPSSGIGGAYRFSAGMQRHTTSTLNDRTIEVFLKFAEIHPLEADIVDWARSFAEVKVFSPAEPEPYWLSQVNNSKSKDVGDIANAISSVLQQLRVGGIQAVDRSLSKIKFADANEYLLVSVLRTLSKNRSDLIQWKSIVRDTRKLLDIRNLPSEMIMKGLDVA